LAKILSILAVEEFKQLTDLLKALEKLPSRYIYRGHSCYDWELQSSLERVLGKNYKSKAKEYEEFALKFFKRRFHLHDNLKAFTPTSKLEWLSIMQHYGFRTRMLDFTYSPYVALYFALENMFDPNIEKFAICAIDEEGILKQSLKYLKEKDKSITTNYEKITEDRNVLFEKIDVMSPEVLWITEPASLNPRLEMQQGCFLFSGKSGKSIENLFEKDLYNSVKNYLFIAPCSKPHEILEIYELLKRMNIDGRTIYGGLEGLARSSNLEMYVKRNL